MPLLYINNYIIATPIETILLDIKKELKGQKLKDIKVKGNDIRVTCPNKNHKNGQEDSPDCGIYIGPDQDRVKYGTFNCFACEAGGSFTHFVALCFECSDKEAEKWLCAKYGELQEESGALLTLEPIVLKSTKKKEAFLDEKLLNEFEDFHPYMLKRHLDLKVCKQFKVKYDSKTECLVFPVWDDVGRLYMLTRRSVNNKTFIIDMNKEKPIYLLNYIKKYNLKEVTLCESQINTLSLWSWGIPSIASFGCNITPKQIDLINKSGINHLYLAFDPDEAGIKGTKKCLMNLSENIIVDVIIFPHNKDVNDLTEEEFNKLKIVSGKEWLNEHENK